MNLIRTIGLLVSKKYFGSLQLPVPKHKSLISSVSAANPFLFSSNIQQRNVHTTCKKYINDDREIDDYEDNNDGPDEFKQLYDQPGSVKNVLYPNSTDLIINQLNECASVQEVLDFVSEHEGQLGIDHIAQAVLVLWELQRMFYHVSFSDGTSKVDIYKYNKVNEEYTSTLIKNSVFNKMLNLIADKRAEFNLDELSCIVLYLTRIGLNIKHDVLQILIERFKEKLFHGEFSLTALSRFLVAIFNKANLSYIYNIQGIIPLVFQQIGKCTTAEEFKLITICLNHMHILITDNILLDYKRKLHELIDTNIITSNEYKTIIKVVLFLNHPEWRNKNIHDISKCMLILKNCIYLLNVNEVLVLYEILQRNQEPADMLNEIQRCASKFFIHLEEDMGPLDVRLKLFSCLVYFSSPSQRPNFMEIIKRYAHYDLDGDSLLEFYKILIYSKISDISLHKIFWDKTLLSLEDQAFRESNLLKICYNYIHLNQDACIYRHYKLERRILEWLEEEFNEGISALIPSRFSSMASFILIYSQKQELVEYVVDKIIKYEGQFNHSDCINLSYGIQIGADVIKNDVLEKEYVNSVKTSLNKCTYRIVSEGCDHSKTVMLLKSYIFRECWDSKLFDELIRSYSTFQNLSSNLIKNAAFCLYTTSTLLPTVIEKMTEYVIQNKNCVIGFNVERIIYLCYALGYWPKNSDRFFETVSDIILRDQERLSGLSYLQTCLSLCYFNKLPHSFIQQIFNVEFLDKLDIELANCYYKDVYPLRVRNNMMQLNRAVCLDYPESNVPWFHQKYIDDIKTKGLKYDNRYNFAQESFKQDLLKITNDEKYIEQDQITPYGYHINFVINLDGEGKISCPENAKIKIAILLLRSNAYTNVNVLVKGQFQLKIRHLEILGYKVIPINFDEWVKREDGDEKRNCLKQQIFSSIPYTDAIVNR